MSKIYTNGQHGSHDFDERDPSSVLQALLSEAEDRVKTKQRAFENAENAVIAAQIELQAAIAIRDRYDVALLAGSK
ncbi:MAG: hypothetical protein BGN98_13670 [Microbacterium sp. 69-7]|uniref:hypothetical protein n=1 Tax=Microbacterium sp. 69-7 TaxID=1895784 RepID=UPI0009698AD5|nr:hypothetical protein [Microbacterium sp. 69-7]OJU44428.1 MAG: hypothetical protein BGN98_13670 [Microbacterium sp. 69-7]